MMDSSFKIIFLTCEKGTIFQHRTVRVTILDQLEEVYLPSSFI